MIDKMYLNYKINELINKRSPFRKNLHSENEATMVVYNVKCSQLNLLWRLTAYFVTKIKNQSSINHFFLNTMALWEEKGKSLNEVFANIFFITIRNMNEIQALQKKIACRGKLAGVRFTFMIYIFSRKYWQQNDEK